MSYPGDPGLDPKVQQRILTAFGEAARLYREGHAEETRTVLRSILEVDPKFAPAQGLDAAIASGSPVDLASLLGGVTAAASPLDPEGVLAKAREALGQRDYHGGMTLVQALLRELPGHAGARQLALEVQARLRAASEAQSHMSRAREALDAGLVEEARSFANLAHNADAGHPDLAPLMQRVELAAKPISVEPEFEFEVFEHTAEEDEPAPPPPPPPAVRAAAGPAAVSPPIAAAPPPAAAFSFDPSDDAMGFAFGSLPEEVPAAAVAVAAEPMPARVDDNEARVQSLLDQGQVAFDGGDYQAAIDTWSRIYLMDAHHGEAERRIEQARRRREEIEREAEHRFYEAREAFEQGRFEEAKTLCQEVLQLQPQHLEAHDLLVRLETPAVLPPPPPAAPGAKDEDDLFRDDFVPARIASSAATPAVREEGEAVPRGARREAAEGARRPFPIPLVAGIAVLLAVLGVVGFFLRGKVFSGSGSAVADAIFEAEKLSHEGRLQEALTLLQSLQGQVDGEQGNRLNQRVLEYQRRLKAKSAEAARSDTGPITQAIAAGQRIKAFRLVRAGLTRLPSDKELLELQGQLTGYSPALPALAGAIDGRKWDSLRLACDALLKQHPGDAEAERVWVIASFNQAVVLLRQYQVAPAHALLDELARRGDDPEALRLKQLAASYLSRPVDPRYQIFVTNVELRPVD